MSTVFQAVLLEANEFNHGLFINKVKFLLITDNIDSLTRLQALLNDLDDLHPERDLAIDHVSVLMPGDAENVTSYSQRIEVCFGVSSDASRPFVRVF